MTPQHLVFLDETAAKTNLSRLRGRSLAGQRLYASVPFGGSFVLSLDALRKAAEMGFAPAEYELGSRLSSQGKREEAFAWVERSAEKGNPQAVHGLGRAYLIGYGTEKNEKLGNAWLERSREQGFMPGG